MKPLRAILKYFMRQIAVNCSAVRDITPPWYTHQAPRRQWILHSDRWFCSKAFPGSSRELCCPHPGKQRATLAFADHQKLQPWASLVVQWLRICLPMQGTRVRALVWEDPMCRGATRPMSHNYWACASGACAPQQERPAHRDEEWSPRPATREKPSHRNEDPTQP